ncbi:MAG: nuclear transport factor 2 family protein [Chloroflexi bacterium]|nr:MAG: nuclear transport factor 2 family protein [Chloroflexota bacterium]
MKQQATAAAPSDTLLVIQQFHDAFNRHDVDAIMALMTDDCVFENTFPPPDGERYAGAAAVHAFWETFFHNSPNAYFAIEESFTGGDRGVIRWRYTWQDADGQSGHVRGVDIFRVRGGKVAEKLSYVKG